MKRLLLIGCIAIGGLSACTNPDVPAGHEGYVYYTPLLFGQMEFRESLPGPATTGVSWRLSTINVDMRTSSYDEDFKLFTKENLSVDFEVNTRIQLRPGSVKDVVENWGGADWYAWNVKERLRTIVRVEASKFTAVQIQTETPKVKAQIEAELRKRIATTIDASGKSLQTPFVIESVDIGEIHFPEEVKNAIERKIATTQELERQASVLAKVKKDAARTVMEAIGVAQEQLIIASTLDPLYVQRRAIQVYRRIAKSNNKTTIVLPNTIEGTALPKILEPTSRRILSKADQERIGNELKLLEEELTSELGGLHPEDAVEGTLAPSEPDTDTAPVAPEPEAPKAEETAPKTEETAVPKPAAPAVVDP